MKTQRFAFAIGFIGATLLFAQVDDPPPRILFMGDSLTAGFGISPESAFPALVDAQIKAEGLNMEVVNAGLSGETSAGGLRRLNWLLKRPVSILVLELGANDGLRGVSPSETQANLSAIVEQTRAKYPDVAVVVAGMKVPPNMGADYAQRFEAVFPAVAQQYGATLIPFLLEGAAGEPQFNLADGIHPNEAGHQIVARSVWASIEPIVRRLARQSGDDSN